MTEQINSEGPGEPSAHSVAAPNEDEISLLDLLAVLAENARLLFFGPLIAGLIALGISFLITPTFTATTTILPPQQQQSTAAMLVSQLGGLASLAGAAGFNLKNPADLYVALIKSRTIADRIIDRFKLMQVYEAELRQTARKALERATGVSTGKDGLITIEMDDTDPKRAADIANAYVEELFRLNGDLAITDAQQRRVFFEKQLKTAQENLNKAEVALAEVGVPETLLKSSPQAIVAGIARLQALVTAQEVKLSTMRGYVTEQSPEYQRAQRELSSLRAQLAQAGPSQPAKGTQRADYLNRYRDYKYQQTLFELMLQQYEAARLDEAREGAAIQVVDPAVPPERKSKPKKALIAVLTTLSAGMFLILFVLTRGALRNARKDPESASKIAEIGAGLRRLMPRRGKPGLR